MEKTVSKAGFKPKALEYFRLVEETGIKNYTVQQTLKALGWHRTKGGPNGSSPWHQDVGGKCPYEKHAKAAA